MPRNQTAILTSVARLRKLAMRFYDDSALFDEPGRSGNQRKRARQWSKILNVAAERLLNREADASLIERSATRLEKLAAFFTEGDAFFKFTGRSGKPEKLNKQWATILKVAAHRLRGSNSSHASDTATV